MNTPRVSSCNSAVQEANTSLPIVFIDSEEDELQSVVNQILPGSQVIFLQTNQNWVKQMTETLAERHGAALASDQSLEPISVGIIFRRLYHLAQAVIKSYSHQLFTYFVERYKRLSVLKPSASDIEKMPPVPNQSRFEEA